MSVGSEDAAGMTAGDKDGGAVSGGAGHRAEMTIARRYLLLPIDNAKGNNVSISLAVDGVEVRFLEARLANAEADTHWWAFLHVDEFMGKTAVLRVDPLPNAEPGVEIKAVTDEGFKRIRQADQVPGAEKWGSEALRPKFHFSQKVGWINDVNGMVYYDGEWHLFFQHNPVGLLWGNMTWGHAVSRDLVNWKQLPNVLHHRRGDAMFSGGGAVDWKNTGGWKRGENDVIVIAWTSTGRGECIAYSNDKGRTFTEYEGNPVIRHEGRDPKPVWYAYGPEDRPLNEAAAGQGGHWVIVVFDLEEGHDIAFYTSTDLKEWTLRSRLRGYHECPELFRLPVIEGDSKFGIQYPGERERSIAAETMREANQGDPRSESTNQPTNELESKWVIFGADAHYAVGDFDGRTFTSEHEGKRQLHYGAFYASQCFSDAPDGRCVQVGWTGMDIYGAPFNQTFTIPTELTLRRTPQGIRLFGEPVKEIEKIEVVKRHVRQDEPLVEGRPVRLAPDGVLLDIRAVFELGTARQVGLRVDNRPAISFDGETVSSKGSPLAPLEGCSPPSLERDRIGLRILLDPPMMETFVNGGRMAVTSYFRKRSPENTTAIEAFAEGGEARLVSLEVRELDAKWP